jgi:hypothetical protein
VAGYQLAQPQGNVHSLLSAAGEELERGGLGRPRDS